MLPMSPLPDLPSDDLLKSYRTSGKEGIQRVPQETEISYREE